MVKRAESTVLNEFEGIVKKVTFEENAATGIRQYHFEIEATNVAVGGKTGMFHEWIPLSAKASEDQIPVGSVLDRFVQMLEAVLPGADKAKTVSEVFEMTKGKKFRFKKMKLGRDYDGHKAKEYSTPVALLA